MKSALLSACSASRTNAPIAVPLRRTCLDKTNSFRPSRYFARLTTRSAKANDLSLTMFSFILNYPLSILHSRSRRFLPRGPSQVNNQGIAKDGDGQPPPNSPFSIFHSPFPSLDEGQSSPGLTIAESGSKRQGERTTTGAYVKGWIN